MLKGCMFVKAVLLSAALLASPAMAASLPDLAIPVPPIQVAARAYLLTDLNSGDTLASQNAHERMPMASLTKLMTAYLAFTALQEGKLHLNQVVPVSAKAAHMGGSRMFLDPRKPVTVDQLLHGLLVDSGNDADIALAEVMAGSEERFVAMMNQTAQQLGLKDTHYANATGLPAPDHYTTAADLTVLARDLLHDFPQVTQYDSLKQFTYNGITQQNWNRLVLTDPRVDGMKTGHTNAAGYCQVTSAQQGNMRLISVVLGTGSLAARAAESEKLLNYGFQFYKTHEAYTPARTLAHLAVQDGAALRVAAGVPAPAFVTVPRGSYSRLAVQVLPNARLKAPLAAGQKVGQIRLSLNGQVVAHFPLVARQPVPEAGWLTRAWREAKNVL
jgi:serine-type D-Ala-D-Ala carboxypeptidase (penicillin-binding protein 5/6)